MSTKMFVNLPVRDLKKSKAFFSALGFTFNPQFSNDDGACMVVSEHNFVMLLTEPFFKTFLSKPMANARESTQVLIALSCDNRAEVEAKVNAALAAGGTTPRPAKDHGFMFQHGFDDLDGNAFEVFWMDEVAAAGS